MHSVKFGFWRSLVAVLMVVSVNGCAVDAADNGEEEGGELGESTSALLSVTVTDYCSRGTYYVTVSRFDTAPISIDFKPNNGASKHLYSGSAKRFTFIPSSAGTVTISGAGGSKSVKVYHEVCGGDFGGEGEVPDAIDELVDTPHSGPSGNVHHGAEP